jgi:hypothetical protein
MKPKTTSLLPGLLFVLCGFWLLLRQFGSFQDLSERILPVFLIVVAIVLLVDAIRRSGSASLFWSVFILQIGIFFLLRNYGLITRIDADEYWPVFLFAFGLAFFLLFLIRPRQWGLFIPAGFLLYIGLLTASETFLDAPDGLDAVADHFGPVFLIVSGVWIFIGFLFESRRRNGNRTI